MNVNQLKTQTNKLAAEKGVSPWHIHVRRMQESLLERLAQSRFQPNFLLKGGFLVSLILGMEARSTLDLDLTEKGLPMNAETLQAIFTEICQLDVGDGTRFALVQIEEIHAHNGYAGFRVHLNSWYHETKLSVPLQVDLTTGDYVTPGEIKLTLPRLFGSRTTQVWAYTLETVMAEKLESLISRSTVNTRLRDFYDLHMLYTHYPSKFDMEVLRRALYNTAETRGTRKLLGRYAEILSSIQASADLREFWRKYQQEFPYAREISFEQICNSITALLTQLDIQ